MSSQELLREKGVPSDEFRQYFDLSTQFVNKAITSDEKGNYKEALEYYIESLKMINYALQLDNFDENLWVKSKHQKKTLKSWRKSCTDRINTLNGYIINPETIPKKPVEKKKVNQVNSNQAVQHVNPPAPKGFVIKKVNSNNNNLQAQKHVNKQPKVKYVQRPVAYQQQHHPRPQVQHHQQTPSIQDQLKNSKFLGSLKNFFFGDITGPNQTQHQTSNNGNYGNVRKTKGTTHKKQVVKPVHHNNIQKQHTNNVSNQNQKLFIPKNYKKKKNVKKNNNTSSINKEEAFKGVDKKLLNSILDDILTKNTSVTFSDIAGLNDAKRIIHEAVILPQIRPDLFNGLRRPPKGVLLFGPPGNGKTLLAKAAANECDCKFFAISASSLVSKWHGESEKMAKALFAAARYLSPSIIFIDEIDSILSSRSSGEHEASRRLKTEFLVQIDGVCTDDNSGVLVMGATNTPDQLDDAILRRFTKRVYIPLPDIKSRIELMIKILQKSNNKYSLSRGDFKEIAKNTEGYSGSDLAALCREASMQPLRELGTSQIMNIRQSELRPISRNDFLICLTKVKPSTNIKVIKNLSEWNNKYGSV